MKASKDRGPKGPVDQPQNPRRRKLLKKLVYVPPAIAVLSLSRQAYAQASCPGQCPSECQPVCAPVCTPVCAPVCAPVRPK